MTETRKIYVLNGPNINMLGTREPEIYGYDTLDDIAERMEDAANRAHVEIDFRQSNHEGHLIDWLQEAHAEGAHAVILNADWLQEAHAEGAHAVILNAAGLTHSSVALHDAIKAITVPVIEVHLSNPHRREEFRHKSYIGMAAKGTIAGFGALSYMLALEAALEL